jgi:DNA mismatch repair protein MutS2
MAASPVIMSGQRVFVGASRRRGTVIRAGKNGFWIVETGSLRMSFPESDLVPAPPASAEEKPLIAQAEFASAPEAALELNVRGMRLGETLEALRRQIDAAALSGLYAFSVVHGKGDGILQRGVHDFLKTDTRVADYFFSRPELGGFGRTEVQLKRG